MDTSSLTQTTESASALVPKTDWIAFAFDAAARHQRNGLSIRRQLPIWLPTSEEMNPEPKPAAPDRNYIASREADLLRWFTEWRYRCNSTRSDFYSVESRRVAAYAHSSFQLADER